MHNGKAYGRLTVVEDLKADVHIVSLFDSWRVDVQRSSNNTEVVWIAHVDVQRGVPLNDLPIERTVAAATQHVCALIRYKYARDRSSKQSIARVGIDMKAVVEQRHSHC